MKAASCSLHSTHSHKRTASYARTWTVLSCYDTLCVPSPRKPRGNGHSWRPLVHSSMVAVQSFSPAGSCSNSSHCWHRTPPRQRPVRIQDTAQEFASLPRIDWIPQGQLQCWWVSRKSYGLVVQVDGRRLTPTYTLQSPAAFLLEWCAGCWICFKFRFKGSSGKAPIG